MAAAAAAPHLVVNDRPVGPAAGDGLEAGAHEQVLLSSEGGEALTDRVLRQGLGAGGKLRLQPVAAATHAHGHTRTRSHRAPHATPRHERWHRARRAGRKRARGSAHALHTRRRSSRAPPRRGCWLGAAPRSPRRSSWTAAAGEGASESVTRRSVQCQRPEHRVWGQRNQRTFSRVMQLALHITCAAGMACGREIGQAVDVMWG